MCNRLHLNRNMSSKAKPQLKSKTRNIEKKKSISIFNQMRIKEGIIYTNKEPQSINENEIDISANLKENRE